MKTPKHWEEDHLGEVLVFYEGAFMQIMFFLTVRHGTAVKSQSLEDFIKNNDRRNKRLIILSEHFELNLTDLLHFKIN